jgi:hypothetical protein
MRLNLIVPIPVILAIVELIVDLGEVVLPGREPG